jgi:hypothetical protein
MVAGRRPFLLLQKIGDGVPIAIVPRPSNVVVAAARYGDEAFGFRRPE